MASRFITLLFFVVAFLPFSFARALDANALAVRAPPVFTFKFTGVVNAPSNQAEIPASQTCNSSKYYSSPTNRSELILPTGAGANTYAKTAVIDAVKQGARYKQSGQVASKPQAIRSRGKPLTVISHQPRASTLTSSQTLPASTQSPSRPAAMPTPMSLSFRFSTPAPSFPAAPASRRTSARTVCSSKCPSTRRTMKSTPFTVAPLLTAHKTL